MLNSKWMRVASEVRTRPSKSFLLLCTKSTFEWNPRYFFFSRLPVRSFNVYFKPQPRATRLWMVHKKKKALIMFSSFIILRSQPPFVVVNANEMSELYQPNCLLWFSFFLSILIVSIFFLFQVSSPFWVDVRSQSKRPHLNNDDCD